MNLPASLQPRGAHSLHVQLLPLLQCCHRCQHIRAHHSARRVPDHTRWNQCAPSFIEVCPYMLVTCDTWMRYLHVYQNAITSIHLHSKFLYLNAYIHSNQTKKSKSPVLLRPDIASACPSAGKGTQGGPYAPKPCIQLMAAQLQLHQL